MISIMNMRVGRLGTTKHDTLPREKRNPNRQRRCHVRIRANSTPENEPDAEALEEARLEAIESRLRSTGSSPSGTRGRDRSPSTANQQQKPVGQRAPWKEGQLFPEGWERMDPIEKATELYLGERGILYWSACSLSFWVFLRVGCSGVPVFRCSGVPVFRCSVRGRFPPPPRAVAPTVDPTVALSPCLAHAHQHILSREGTQLTIGGLVLLVVAWIGFRFIGPSLGFYALENDPNL